MNLSVGHLLYPAVIPFSSCPVFSSSILSSSLPRCHPAQYFLALSCHLDELVCWSSSVPRCHPAQYFLVLLAPSNNLVVTAFSRLCHVTICLLLVYSNAMHITSFWMSTVQFDSSFLIPCSVKELETDQILFSALKLQIYCF